MKSIWTTVALLLLLTATPTSDYASSETETQACIPPPSGLVSWWPGEGNALDLVGANLGTINGNVTFAAGMVGQAFRFNGAGHVSVPDHPSLDLAEALTFELWFNRDDVAGWRGLIAKRPSGNRTNYGANLNIDPRFGLGVYYNDLSIPGAGDGIEGWETIRVPVPPAGQWHHFAGTYEQVDPGNIEVKLFLNGQLEESLIMPGSLGNTLNNVPVTIGATRSGFERFVGAIDEVSLYDRALSAAEIHGIHSAGSSGKCKPSEPMRLLFVPLRWQGTQEAFDLEVDAQMDFFLDDIPLNACRDRVLVESLDVATQNFNGFTCTYPNNCGVGTIEPFVRDDLEIDPTGYDLVVGLAQTSPCLPIAGCSNGTDTIWVTEAEDSITAHEIGHIYGLEDQYCSNQAGSTDTRCNDGDSQGDGPSTGDVNWLDAGMPYDCPPDGSDDSTHSPCCNHMVTCSRQNGCVWQGVLVANNGESYEHRCDTSDYGEYGVKHVNYGVCCFGNKNSGGGRSTMSYANAPGPRGYDDHDIAHLSTVPELNCDSMVGSRTLDDTGATANAHERIVDVNLQLHQDDSVVEKSVSITRGRPTLDSVLESQAGDYVLQVVDVNGEVLWSQSFGVQFTYSGPVFSDVDYSEISYDTVDLSYRIPYEGGMDTLRLLHGEDAIFSKRLPFAKVYVPIILRGH